MPATSKHATWSEIHILRVADERVVEHWGVADQLGMLVQLGVIPAPGQVAVAVWSRPSERLVRGPRARREGVSYCRLSPLGVGTISEPGAIQ